jgi:hypothetical protein
MTTIRGRGREPGDVEAIEGTARRYALRNGEFVDVYHVALVRE